MNNVMHQVNSSLLLSESIVSDSYNKHLDYMLDSLERRIEVARATNNTELLTLLELEKITIAPDQVATPAAMVSPVTHDDLRWQGLRDFLFPKVDLQVKQVCDRSGNLWWYAYNPVTGKSVYADTDTEMRLWIKEQA